MNPGKNIYRLRWIILACWVIGCVGLYALVPPGDPAKNERVSFLPANSPYRLAMEKLARGFPRQCGLSQAVIVFERPGGKLSYRDNTYVNDIASRVRQGRPGGLSNEDLAKLSVTSPGLIDLAIGTSTGSEMMRKGLAMFAGKLGQAQPKEAIKNGPSLVNPLRSKVTPPGQAAIVRVNIPSGFITYRSSQIIGHIRQLLQSTPPPTGLKVAVTGTGGYGYDYANFVRQSHHRTTLATLIAVIVILLIVYRAPIAAMVPLVAISLAAAVIIKFMDIIQNMGFSIGLAERIFVFVLMYGAGVDYSLLLISRYREYLRTGRPGRVAIAEALNATFPAISASACTDAMGIAMLVFCRFLIFQTTGPVVALALVVAWLAAVTLVPALVALLGPQMFWPVRVLPGAEVGKIRRPVIARIWPGIARRVTQRPGLVLVLVVLTLAIPATATRKITWVYDALAGIPSQWQDGVGNAAAGVDIVKKHWPIGEIAPVTILISTPMDKPAPGQQRWREISKTLVARLEAIDGVQDIRALTQPLGRGVSLPGDTTPGRMIRSVAQRQYFRRDRGELRLEVLLSCHSMSSRAMKLLGQIRRDIEQSLAKVAPGCRVHIGGATAQMIAIRTTTQKDFKLVVVLVLGVIFLVVLALLRDWLMTLFMVAAIALSYLATLGLCAWAFTWYYGHAGMDWKVEIFLFVVMASVGVDYSIFLASRVSQEARTCAPAEAIRRAIIHTGPVISSCGLIMAATLGSLMAGQIELLHQLGFSLALGMLIDTFIVRPLLLPAFATIFKRTGR